MRYRKICLKILSATFIVVACNKNNLNQPALGELDESKIANKRGVEALLIGAYSLLDGYSKDTKGEIGGWGSASSNWIYGSICGSQAYTGSTKTDQPDIRNIEKFMPGASNYLLDQKWSAMYAGIQRANTVLRVMKKASDIKEEDRNRIEAEARFLRAFYHFEAIKMWHWVPFVDETITYDAGNYHLSNDKLIWPSIENDFMFAFEHLYTIMDAVGRANKYAAEAFLAKVYVFEHKFAEAQPLFQDLIDNGVTAGGKKYALVNYADNFNAETKNSPEAVFSAQMSVNDPGLENGNGGDNLNFPIVGPGGCCGFFQPTQFLVNHFKTDPLTGLPDLDHFNDVPVKNDQGLKSTDPFVPYDGTLDPRLDWTVGRRGIPYLDYGDHPGDNWIRDQAFSGPYSPKKNVYYKSQEGIYNYAGGWPMQTANNVNLIRYAEVLLLAAEVEAEIGDLEKAREYVNQVRARSAVPSGWVKRADGSPAANYFTGLYTNVWIDRDYAQKAIRFERTLELAMEGHRFFDLVRWGIAESEIDTYLFKEKTLRTYLDNVMFVKNTNEYFPIPQKQIDLSAGPDGIPKMKQNPGY